MSLFPYYQHNFFDMTYQVEWIVFDDVIHVIYNISNRFFELKLFSKYNGDFSAFLNLWQLLKRNNEVWNIWFLIFKISQKTVLLTSAKVVFALTKISRATYILISRNIFWTIHVRVYYTDGFYRKCSGWS